MMFRCPKCQAPLIRKGMTYICENHHSYDCAKSGYVNLTLSHKKQSGDDPMMVKARTRFLAHGYYEPLQKALITELQAFHPHLLIDAGCGQGYYTNALAAHLADCTVYGFDLSKTALKTATKGNQAVHYAVASVAQLPLADACADGIIAIFAPIYETEIMRLLKPGGIMVRVGPGPRHLWELKQLLYDDVYENDPAKSFSSLTLHHDMTVDETVVIDDQEDLQALFAMTPYVYRTSREKADRLKEVKCISLRLQFHIEIWQK